LKRRSLAFFEKVDPKKKKKKKKKNTNNKKMS